MRVKEPSPSEAKGVAKIQNDTVKAREAEAKISLPFDRTRKKSLFLQPKSKVVVGRIRFLG